MKPVQFEDANITLVGDGVGDLPAYRGDGIFITRWQPSLRERLSMLLFGSVWIAILGNHHPPVSIIGGRSASFHYQPAGVRDEDTDRDR